MGKTKQMEENERKEQEIKLKKANIPTVEILTDEMKKMAGLDRKVVPDFSSGTAGLKRIKKEGKRK